VRERVMSARSLAETVILQSIEDLFSRNNQRESMRFFNGDGFRLFADIAGLGPEERKKILEIYRASACKGRQVHWHRRSAVGGAS
jgi:hypothetical protein